MGMLLHYFLNVNRIGFSLGLEEMVGTLLLAKGNKIVTDYIYFLPLLLPAVKYSSDTDAE